MTVKVDRLPGRLRAAEVRDGRGHLVEEGHVLPPVAGRGPRIVLGDRLLVPGVVRDLVSAELALLESAERLAGP